MASPTSNADDPATWPGRVIRHDVFTATLNARRDALGQPEMPRNAGNRRTPAKRAMLKTLEDLGAKW